MANIQMTTSLLCFGNGFDETEKREGNKGGGAWLERATREREKGCRFKLAAIFQLDLVWARN